MLLSSADWFAARDARFLLEAAARDAETDLADRPTPMELRAIVKSLVDSIDHLIAVSPEVKAISGP